MTVPEEVIVKVPPTVAFETTVGRVTVRTALYGAVSDERLVREQAAAKYRAEQLS